VKGDFQARFRGNVRVKFPCVTRLTASMKNLGLILVIGFLFCFSFCKTSETKRIDMYVLSIDKSLKQEKLYSKKYDNVSLTPNNGIVTGYYSKNKLVFINTVYPVEYCCTTLDYYVLNDSLVFVKESAESYNADSVEKIKERIKEKTGSSDENFDFRTVPRETNDRNFYYIVNNKIVDYKLMSFNKERDAREFEIDDFNKTIVEYYNKHLEELK
jgi:hypothetical protein